MNSDYVNINNQSVVLSHICDDATIENHAAFLKVARMCYGYFQERVRKCASWTLVDEEAQVAFGEYLQDYMNGYLKGKTRKENGEDVQVYLEDGRPLRTLERGWFSQANPGKYMCETLMASGI